MPPSTLSFVDTQFATTYGIPTGSVYRFFLQNCTAPSSFPVTAKRAPLVIFSHGAAASLYLYQTILSAIASSGFTVIAIDHTYDAAIVEFPDGTVAFNNYPPALTNGTLAEQDDIFGNLIVPVRRADVTSVLDAVERGSIPGLESFIEVNGTNVSAAVIGHSLGGTTAILAGATDERVVGAMTMDGVLVGEVLNKTVDVPVLLFESEGSVTLNNEVGPSFNASWANFQTWKEWIYVNGTAHLSYTDLGVVVDLLGLRDQPSGIIAQATGTITGIRILEIVWRWSVGFLGKTLKGQETAPFFGDPSEEFPEVTTVRSNL
ncbi:MAG: hypothetical protein M1820_002078 [Bogoriella megaspora]|nr:MAG: hypothetical protein M1820_002078 [Bogoriella megaspora]